MSRYDLAARETGSSTIKYTYDALDRLVSVVKNGEETRYSYDPMNRRLSKKQGGNEQLFLYHGQEEIGLYENGSVKEFRLLGNNNRNPMIALELQGALYIPTHDMAGNVVCLQDSLGSPVERYRYTAFGESEILSPDGALRPHSALGNPWQYASKRLDEETGFVHFGLRYYAPDLGRWTSPDPIGTEDGPNLYAYVKNSPLNYFDQFGLFSLSFSLDNCSIYPGISNITRMINRTERPDTEFSTLPKVTYDDEFEKRNPEYEPSCVFDLGLPEHKDMRILCINGINNTKEEAMETARYISELAGGYNVHGVYNATHGIKADLEECKMGLRHIATTPVRLLHQEWNDFFENSSSDAKLLMIPHSQGNIHQMNGLLDYDERRERILVVGIAPGGYSYRETCGQLVHYMAKWNRDFIPRLDSKGRRRSKDTIIELKSHRKAPWLDHTIMSPTYRKPLRQRIKQYISSQGQEI